MGGQPDERFMDADRPPFGIFTTDALLVVRAWDDWMAEVTGIPAERACDRSLAELVPDFEARGIRAAFDNVLTHGTVEVLAPALHQWLIPCPPSEPVEGYARMQQHVTIGPLREQGRIVGTIVAIEDVTARVAHERRLAARLKGTAQKREFPAFADDRRDGRAEEVTRLLADEDWRTRRAAVESAAAHGNAIVSSLVQLLRMQHRNFSVLSSALDLLAITDIEVVPPLIACLEDPDPDLRMQAALILGDRRDPRAIGPLIARLSDPDANVQFHAIEALGKLRAAEACDALLAIAERREFFLGFPAIHALARAGSAAIAPRLVPLLADEILRAPVVEALGELGDEEAVPPLVVPFSTPPAHRPT